MLISIEIMLLSITFLILISSINFDDIFGQTFAIYIITIAGAESAIGLGILVAFYRLNLSLNYLFPNSKRHLAFNPQRSPNKFNSISRIGTRNYSTKTSHSRHKNYNSPIYKPSKNKYPFKPAPLRLGKTPNNFLNSRVFNAKNLNTNLYTISNSVRYNFPFSQVNRKPILKNKFYSTASNNTVLKNSCLTPEFISGLFDGQGSFVALLLKNSRYKIGYNAQVRVQLKMHEKDRALINAVRNFFGGIGSVSNPNNSKTVEFRVNSLKDIVNVIIPHFIKYPFTN